MISLYSEELEIIINILNDYIKKGKVYALGSRYKNNNRKFSDFDIAIDMAKNYLLNF